MIIKKSELQAAIKSISWAVDEKSPQPIMSHCFLSESQISGFSHAAYLIHKLDCESAPQPMRCCIPFADLKACVERAPGDDIAIELKDEYALIRSGTARWQLNTLPADAGLEYLSPEHPNTVEIDGAELRAAMKFVAHAQGREDVRFYLNGTFLTIGARGEIRAVATDGYRMAWRGDGIENPVWSGIIQEKIAKKFMELQPDRLTFDPTNQEKLWFAAENVHGWIALIHSAYPDISKFLMTPTATGSQLNASTVSSWYDAANRLAPFSGQTGMLKFSPDQSGIEVTANDQNKKAEAKDRIEGKYPGKPRSFMLNARIVLDALSQIHAQIHEDVIWHEVNSPNYGQRLATANSGVLLMEMK